MSMPSHISGRLFFVCTAWCWLGLAVPASGATNDWRVTWFSALQTGDVKVVSALLREGADPRVSDKRGEPSLALAAGYGHVPIVKALLDAGVPVDEAGRFLGNTALMAAAAQGRLEVVRLLVERQCTVDQQDMRQMTALNYAILGGHSQVARLLLAAGAQPDKVGLDGESCLLYCADPDLMKELIARGADVNVRQPRTGATLLMRAAESGSRDVVRSLLAAKADVKARSSDGCTALFLAAAGGFADVVDLLVKQGAELEAAEERRGMTPLMMAAKNGDLMTVQSLVAAGARINAMDKYGTTAVLLAREKGHDLVFKFLLSKGGRDDFSGQGAPSLLLANQALVELRQLEQACENYYASIAKPQPLTWTIIEPHIVRDTPLHARRGRDLLGNPYLLASTDEIPRLAKASQEAFRECLQKNRMEPSSFWGKYATEVVLTPNKNH